MGGEKDRLHNPIGLPPNPLKADYAGADVTFRTEGNRASGEWEGLKLEHIEWR